MSKAEFDLYSDLLKGSTIVVSGINGADIIGFNPNYMTELVKSLKSRATLKSDNKTVIFYYKLLTILLK